MMQLPKQRHVPVGMVIGAPLLLLGVKQSTLQRGVWLFVAGVLAGLIYGHKNAG